MQKPSKEAIATFIFPSSGIISVDANIVEVTANIARCASAITPLLDSFFIFSSISTFLQQLFLAQGQYYQVFRPHILCG